MVSLGFFPVRLWVRSKVIQHLFLQVKQSMYAMALHIVNDPPTAFDMVSEVCVNMFEKANQLLKIAPDKRKAYILSMVKNASLMELRRRRREVCSITNEMTACLQDPSATEDVDFSLIAEDEKQALHRALHRLPSRQRELLEIKYFQQLTNLEISQRMKIHPNSVRYYLTNARRAIEKELLSDSDFSDLWPSRSEKS